MISRRRGNACAYPGAARPLYAFVCYSLHCSRCWAPFTPNNCQSRRTRPQRGSPANHINRTRQELSRLPVILHGRGAITLTATHPLTTRPHTGCLLPEGTTYGKTGDGAGAGSTPAPLRRKVARHLRPHTDGRSPCTCPASEKAPAARERSDWRPRRCDLWRLTTRSVEPSTKWNSAPVISGYHPNDEGFVNSIPTPGPYNLIVDWRRIHQTVIAKSLCWKYSTCPGQAGE